MSGALRGSFFSSCSFVCFLFFWNFHVFALAHKSKNRHAWSITVDLLVYLRIMIRIRIKISVIVRLFSAPSRYLRFLASEVEQTLPMLISSTKRVSPEGNRKWFTVLQICILAVSILDAKIYIYIHTYSIYRFPDGIFRNDSFFMKLVRKLGY